MAMPRRNVLIFHSGALGDFVLSWPLAMGVARVMAQSRILYVAARQKGLLAEKVLGVESVDVEGGWHALFAEGGGAVAEAVAKGIAGAGLIVCFGDISQRWRRNAAAINPEAKVLALRARPAAGGAVHAVDDLLGQLQTEPVLHEAVRQMLAWIRARGLIHPWPGAERRVLVHPGSGGAAKCWPKARFVEAIEALRERGMDVRVAIGEVEVERWSPDERRAFEAVAPVVVTSTYLELLGEIRSAGVFLGNDSGPGHLAGMCGARVVSVFTVTDPAVWAPIGPRVVARVNPGVAEFVDAAVGSGR